MYGLSPSEGDWKHDECSPPTSKQWSPISFYGMCLSCWGLVSSTVTVPPSTGRYKMVCKSYAMIFTVTRFQPNWTSMEMMDWSCSTPNIKLQGNIFWKNSVSLSPIRLLRDKNSSQVATLSCDLNKAGRRWLPGKEAYLQLKTSDGSPRWLEGVFEHPGSASKSMESVVKWPSGFFQHQHEYLHFRDTDAFNCESNITLRLVESIPSRLEAVKAAQCGHWTWR